MDTVRHLATALTVACLAAAVPLVAQENPLQPFERLIGGTWELEGSTQEFEWGVGRKFVVSRSYFIVDGNPRKVSEGFWYWHPGEKEIRGVFVAIDMPVQLFDYTTRFEGGKMISRLRSYTTGGEESVYTEIFHFKIDGQYEWSLYEGSDEGQAKAMGGTFIRK